MPISESEMIQRMLKSKRIAIVGLSDDPSRPSYGVAKYLLSQGYQIIPVNPNCKTALGLKAVASLAELNGMIDLVNVFRRSEACAQVAQDAVAAGARGIWLQSGIRNEQARQMAVEAQIDFVQDRCIMIEKMRQE